MDKPFLTIERQAQLLKDRGLVVCDQKELEHYLLYKNYYHISGYLRQFQVDPKHHKDNYITRTNFETIKTLMVKDSDLRSQLFRELSKIELAIRSIFAYELGKQFGDSAFYLDEGFYRADEERSGQIISKLLQDLEKSNSLMVKRYSDDSVKGEGLSDLAKKFRDVPIWVAIEVVSFGHLATILNYIKDFRPSKETAATLSVQWEPFVNTVHSFSVLRNACAHHHQLWNRRLSIQCPLPKKFRPRNIEYDGKGLYPAFLMIKQYIKTIEDASDDIHDIEELIFSDEIYAKGILLPNPK